MPRKDPLSLTPHRVSIAFIVLFSVVVNMLMLTGPLFMLQVYDRVLSSRSEETLAALFLLVLGLYGAMGLLDFVRGRIGARIGAQLQDALDKPVFKAVMLAACDTEDPRSTALSDIEAVRRFSGAPVAFSLIDLPFTPLFLAAIFLFHPALGWLALAGGGLLIGLSSLNQISSRKPNRHAAQSAGEATRVADQFHPQAAVVQALGMTDAVLGRWRGPRNACMQAEVALSDINGGFSAASKSLRLLLQSAMLALGAWLVLAGDLTPGAMIAASILLGRALAPVEQVIAGWSVVARARTGWISLRALLDRAHTRFSKTRLGTPKARLDVQGLTVLAPRSRTPILRQVSFQVEPGQALGIIGESASGKTSIGKVLTGIWQPAAGLIKLDGASLGQYRAEDLCSTIGYLPQDVFLFEGTIAQNIARMQTNPPTDHILDAAKRAGAHDMIKALPDGYDTQVGASGTQLSGGQKQRIGLARAMYGAPVALVLDEPNANLDEAGTTALNAAIRQMKSERGIVIVMAHRPAAITECDLVLVMKSGRRVAFGPRDEVLRRNLQSPAQAIAPWRQVS